MTVDEILDPKLQSKRIAEDKAMADEFDERTGTDELIRSSETYQILVRKLDLMRDLMGSTTNPNDRVLYADHIERLEKIVALEATRLGL